MFILNDSLTSCISQFCFKMDMGSECIVLNVDNWNSIDSSKLRRSGNIWVYVRLKSGLGKVFCPGRLKFGIQLVQAGMDSGISLNPTMILYRHCSRVLPLG